MTHSREILQRQKEIHSNNADLAKALFNSTNSIVLSSNNLALRISPRNPFYSRLKDLLDILAADHYAHALNLDAHIKGIEVPIDYIERATVFEEG